MSPPVTPQYLLEGAVYALEQCGLLLRDANILFRSGSHASVVVLAAFAREELGRSTILFDLRQKVLDGKNFTIGEIQVQCEDHEIKQKAGMLSTIITGSRGVGRLLQAYLKPPQSAEWQNAHAELEKIRKIKEKRVPGERHKSRMSSLYIEPLSEVQWNRPANTSSSVAHEFLRHAVNDYAGRYQQRYITSDDPILKHVKPELYNALKQWSDRPELPPPEWPPWPDAAYDKSPHERPEAARG
jgi:AbiV family abortive infection protein